jgi:hypothetical protein
MIAAGQILCPPAGSYLAAYGSFSGLDWGAYALTGGIIPCGRRLTGMPGSLTGALATLLQLAGHLLAILAWADNPQRLAVLAVAVLAAVALGALAAGASLTRTTAGLPVLRRVAALREKSWRVAFQRQRDPDARGRTRPRAPSAARAAA